MAKATRSRTLQGHNTAGQSRATALQSIAEHCNGIAKRRQALKCRARANRGHTKGKPRAHRKEGKTWRNGATRNCGRK
nr:MAG TPA: hypothetical protein [Caudoviricetes sp.]